MVLLRTLTCALAIAATATATTATASGPAHSTIFHGPIISGTGPHGHLRGHVRFVLHPGALTADTPTTSEARFTLSFGGPVLSGSISGRAHGTRPNPDVGMSFTLRGSGVVKPLGAVVANGTMRGLGFVHDGRFHLILTVHPHSGGTLTVSGTGPVEPGFSSPF